MFHCSSNTHGQVLLEEAVVIQGVNDRDGRTLSILLQYLENALLKSPEQTEQGATGVLIDTRFIDSNFICKGWILTICLKTCFKHLKVLTAFSLTLGWLKDTLEKKKKLISFPSMPSKKGIHKINFCCFRLENSFSVLKLSTKQTADILKPEAP